MSTNLSLDNDLIREAMKWGNHKTKRAAVTAALEDYIALLNRQKQARASLNSGKKRSPVSRKKKFTSK